MTDPTVILWIVLMLIGFIGSAIYSGLETGAYRINRVRLEILAHENNVAAKRLHRLLHAPTTLLTTLLIGNNVANYLGTAGLAVILERAGVGEAKTIILNAVLVTPILFVFGETLPKDLFAAHADRLMYPFARVLDASRSIFKWTGLLGVVMLFSNHLIRALGPKHEDIAALHPRRRVTDLVSEAVGHGLISDEQSSMVQRVLALGHVTVADEMTPWRQVQRVSIDADIDALHAKVDITGRTRYVVVDGSGAAVGVIDAVATLLAARQRDVTIRDMTAELPTYPRKTLLRDALADMQQRRVALAVVTDRNKPVGIVTLKDLVEPLTGELTTW